MDYLKQILLQTYKESLSALSYVFISLISSGKKEDRSSKDIRNEYQNDSNNDNKKKNQEEFDIKLFLKYATDKDKKRYRAMWYKEKELNNNEKQCKQERFKL